MSTNGHHDEAEGMEKIVSDVKEKGKTLLNEGWENARHALDEKADLLRRKADEIGEKSVEEIADDVRQYVRKFPLKSLGIGFCAGLLFGMVIKD